MTRQPYPPSMVLMAAAVLLCGCRTMRAPWDSAFFGKDKEAGVPDRMLVVWSDTVLHQPGKPGTRGFGGRVYFYRDGKKDPISVDGQLTVYAFDSEQLNPSEAAPAKKYVITPEQLSNHHSKTSMGDSYSVWVPWGPVGGPNQSLSLITRFDGKNGGTVMSESTNKLLPGVAPSIAKRDVQVARTGVYQEQDDVAEPRKIQTVALDEPLPIDANNAQAQALTAFSFDLPESFVKQMSAGEIATEADGLTTRLGRPSIAPNVMPLLPASRATDALPPPVTDSEPARFPARREPRVQPTRAPLRRQPHPGGWPSSLPPTPRSGNP